MIKRIEFFNIKGEDKWVKIYLFGILIYSNSCSNIPPKKKF